VFLVDRNQQRRRLLETALELESNSAETEDEADAQPESDGAPGTDAGDRIIMMSPKAARRFGIRPPG
jgi:hypothetical protein